MQTTPTRFSRSPIPILVPTHLLSSKSFPKRGQTAAFLPSSQAMDGSQAVRFASQPEVSLETPLAPNLN